MFPAREVCQVLFGVSVPAAFYWTRKIILWFGEWIER